LFLRQIPVATLKLELAPRVVRLLLFLSQMVLALTVLIVVTPEGEPSRQIPVATLKLELAPRVVRLLLFLSQMVLALTVLMVVTPEG